MRNSDRKEWLLKNLPAYEGNNTLSKVLYDSGSYIQRRDKENNAACLIQCVESTTKEEVMSYVETLRGCGFQEDSYRTIEDKLFYRFVQGNSRVFVNYFGHEEKAMIALEEEKGISAKEISYEYVPKVKECAEFYMFGIKMDPNGMNVSVPENTSGYLNNGQSMFVKCADNSIILIDGGHSCQMEPDDEERFSKLLHQITGKDGNETITISAWFITHAHPDHVQGFARALREHPKKYKVERVICNLPNPASLHEGQGNIVCHASNTIAELCPDSQEIKVHTGDVIQIADVTITILYTHEDLSNEEGKFGSKDFNSTSTVAMMETSNGMKMLVTGDITTKAEKVLCNHFSRETLKCDILQQPHHNFNNNSVIYESADAPIMFILQTPGGLVKNQEMIERSTLAKKWCREWYSGGNETVGFSYEDGEVKQIYYAQDIYNYKKKED